MAVILVTYYSQTGNTKKVAQAIYEALPEEKVIKPLNQLEKEKIDKYDLIFIGFPVQSHSVPLVVEAFLKIIPPNKKIALFSTHGSLTGSRLAREAIEYASILTSKAKILGTFSCRGKVSLAGLKALEKSPEHKAWSEMAYSASIHPDEHDLADARTFAHWVLTLFSQA
ncbi:MAG: flavodoxin family protein [Candidatus Aminicenantales bacterium]